ncbi:MAG: hypothetical protein IJZ25_00835, partial [Lachnospiraceae bacterium]|nr:hypothetical protein [Lachnospiraceae bacterium]
GNELVKNIAINYYNSSKWSGWNTFATTADLATALAGYFPLDGSKALTGSIRQTVGSGAASYRMINNNRDIELFMGAGGEFHLTDNTHNNHIIYSDKDGKTTANLTATGNIARSSTTVQMINSTNAGGLSLNNLNGDGLTVLRFHDNGTQMGMLGFNGSNNPVYRTNDGSGEYKLIHSGNYSSYALPLTGGTVNISGNMDFYKASDVVIGVRNTTSGGTTSYISMQAAGAPNNVYIGNNNGNAYVVAADGYGYILHTANYTDYTIAKNGGGEINGYTQIKHNHDIPLAVQNTNASQDTVYVGFADATDTLIGWIGYNGKQLTTYDRVSNANKEIHHDGNSAKVAIQESAPTDTTALWVDTANNKVKAYKDGAWTAMA